MTASWKDRKSTLTVHGRRMAFVDEGEGRPIVFLHGNPTSSYLWRNVLPHVRDRGRCIAPDLIGMGDSEKLPDPGPNTYTFATHARYLDGFLDALDLQEPVILVLHDWGSGLGFHWARRHPDRVAGIVHMESLVRPFPDWGDWDPGAAKLFQGFRSDAGEDLILNRNLFVERVLPGSILRPLEADEMAEYRRPFQNPDDRWPTLTWPRQIPVGGVPPDVHALMASYAHWLTRTEIPKLMFDAEPGAILTGTQRLFALGFPNQTVVRIKGSHFVQEDAAGEIGAGLADWLESLPPPSS